MGIFDNLRVEFLGLSLDLEKHATDSGKMFLRTIGHDIFSK